MSNRNTDRRVALVTGASYGVGQATALALAQNGYDVAVTTTSLGRLDATCAKVAETGAQVAPLRLDLESQDSIDAAMDVAVSRFGTAGRVMTLLTGSCL